MVIAGGTQTKVGLPLNAAAAERASSRAVDLPAPAGKRSAAAPPEDDEGGSVSEFWMYIIYICGCVSQIKV
jgi:hypothetical protein